MYESQQYVPVTDLIEHCMCLYLFMKGKSML
uniref:Uncharacterized protein n=1 Tax=Anguilla anguilla TaxID=7936 RepID=A0A0E9XJB1_ANGAN